MSGPFVRADAVDRQVADLVDDVQPRHRVVLELFFQPAFAQRAREHCDHVRSGSEEHAVAGLDRLQTQADREVRLAHTGRSQDDNVLAVLDEMAVGQLLDLLFVYRGLIAELERVQALYERESRQVRAHRDVLGRLCLHFFGKQPLQEVCVRELLGGCLL